MKPSLALSFLSCLPVFFFTLQTQAQALLVYSKTATLSSTSPGIRLEFPVETNDTVKATATVNAGQRVIFEVVGNDGAMVVGGTRPLPGETILVFPFVAFNVNQLPGVGFTGTNRYGCGQKWVLNLRLMSNLNQPHFLETPVTFQASVKSTRREISFTPAISTLNPLEERTFNLTGIANEAGKISFAMSWKPTDSYPESVVIKIPETEPITLNASMIKTLVQESKEAAYSGLKRQNPYNGSTYFVYTINKPSSVGVITGPTETTTIKVKTTKMPLNTLVFKGIFHPCSISKSDVLRAISAE